MKDPRFRTMARWLAFFFLLLVSCGILCLALKIRHDRRYWVADRWRGEREDRVARIVQAMRKGDLVAATFYLRQRKIHAELADGVTRQEYAEELALIRDAMPSGLDEARLPYDLQLTGSDEIVFGLMGQGSLRNVGATDARTSELRRIAQEIRDSSAEEPQWGTDYMNLLHVGVELNTFNPASGITPAEYEFVLRCVGVPHSSGTEAALESGD